MASKQKNQSRPPKITAEQEGGDDGYCYVIRLNGTIVVSGITRSEVPYYKQKVLKEWLKRTERALRLEEKVKKAVPRIWAEISQDVDWVIDLSGAVELCLDADRPVMFGHLTKDEYAELIKLDKELVDQWATEALRGYF